MRAFAVILSVCGVFAMVGAVSAAADSSIGVVDEYIPPGSGPTGGNQGGGGAPPGTPGGTSGGSGGGVLAPISGSPSGSSNATRKAIGPSARGARAGFLPFTGYPLNPLVLVLLLLFVVALFIRLYVGARQRTAHEFIAPSD
jgi:hypothetical protein